MFSVFFIFLSVLIVVSSDEAEDCDYDYYWRDYNGTIPSDAIEAGRNSNKPFYIGQAYVRNYELLTASIFPGDPAALTSAYDKIFHPKKHVKILCGRVKENFVWIKTESSKLNELTNHHLISGGSEVGQNLYIGRILHQGRVTLGKVFENHLGNKGIWVPNEDDPAMTSVNSLTYEVLSYFCTRSLQNICDLVDVRLGIGGK